MIIFVLEIFWSTSSAGPGSCAVCVMSSIPNTLALGPVEVLYAVSFDAVILGVSGFVGGGRAGAWVPACCCSLLYASSLTACGRFL